MFVWSPQNSIVVITDKSKLETVKVWVSLSDVDSVTQFPKKLIQSRLWPLALLALCSLHTEKLSGPDMQDPQTLQHYGRQHKYFT